MLAVLAVAFGATAPSGPLIARIAKQFDDHALVQIGELHRWGQLHEFMRAMLRDPRFICRADDVVVEFGNSRLQPIADRYGKGGKVSEAEILSMLRETVVPLTWNSPLYRQFLETVREVNRRRLCPHTVRLVLGDQPLDWSKIHDVQEYLPWADRDAGIAATIEREVLAKGHRAFVVTGMAHAVKDSPEGPDASTAQIIERKHPGALFSIVAVVRKTAEALHLAPAPSLTFVRGSDLTRADFEKVWKLDPPKPWPAMPEVVDALLFVGEQTLIYPPPSIYLEPVYREELLRRARIVKAYSGQDFPSVIEGLVKEAEKQRP